jgi:hypothetical protein
MISRQILSLAGAVALAASACGNPTFTEVQTEVFDQSCVFSACHKGASPAGEMNLELDAYDDIVNVPSTQHATKVRVKPGDPSGSYLMDKLLNMPVMGTDEMPPGAPLSEARIDMIRAWIEAGALDD